jgi:hypothetical protein
VWGTNSDARFWPGIRLPDRGENLPPGWAKFVALSFSSVKRNFPVEAATGSRRL